MKQMSGHEAETPAKGGDSEWAFGQVLRHAVRVAEAAHQSERDLCVPHRDYDHDAQGSHSYSNPKVPQSCLTRMLRGEDRGCWEF